MCDQLAKIIMVIKYIWVVTLWKSLAVMRRDRFLACCDKAWKKLLDFVARERASWRRYKLYGDRRWPNMDSWVQEYIQENSSIFTRSILEGYSGSSGDDELILLFTGTTKVKHSICLRHRNGIRKPANTRLRADSGEDELVETGLSSLLLLFCLLSNLWSHSSGDLSTTAKRIPAFVSPPVLPPFPG